jgi:hypothetical protein
MDNRVIITGIIIIVVIVIIYYYLNDSSTKSCKRRENMESIQDNTLFLNNDNNSQKLNYVLWTHHVVWTRMYIIAALGDNKNEASAVLNRLMRNQEDIGNSIRNIVGDNNANMLIELLKEHITIASDIVEDVKVGNDKVNYDIQRWIKNADDISQLLSTLGFDYNNTKAMFMDHLNLTKAELLAIKNGDYNADINTFDKVLFQAFDMADMFTIMQ